MRLGCAPLEKQLQNRVAPQTPSAHLVLNKDEKLGLPDQKYLLYFLHLLDRSNWQRLVC